MHWLALLVALPLGAYLNAARGGNAPGLGKTPNILLLGLLNGGLSAFAVMQHYGEWWWVIVFLVLFVLAELAEKTPSWGETWPNGLDTSGEEFARGVRGVADWIMRFPYSSDTTEPDATCWKILANGVRWALYGVPKAVLISAVSLSPAGLVYTASCFLVGLFYRVGYHREGPGGMVKFAETHVGWFQVMVVGVLVL